MALPEWPAGLPVEPVLEGTSIVRLHQPPIRTEMEDGPGRARRRTTTTWSEVTLRLALDPDQFATFQAFIRDTLDHSSSRWTMPVWKPGVAAPWDVKTVRLNDDVKVDYTVAFVLVTLPLLVLDY